MTSYPDVYAVQPLAHTPKGARVRPPGSKSLTNRALIVSSLAEGRCKLTGALDCDDTRVMVESLQRLGFVIEHNTETSTILIEGEGGRIPKSGLELFVGNSGTSLRFLTALVTLGHGTYRLDGVPRMRERPVADLLAALNRLGTDVRSEANNGCPPVIVHADEFEGGFTEVRGDISSQFLSAMLMVLPYAARASTVEVHGTLVSTPYISMTMGVMEFFGVTISNHNFRQFNVGRGRYRPRNYAIEPDASSASYWFAAAGVTGGSIIVDGIGNSSAQGDMAFLEILEHMGCRVERGVLNTTVHGGPLRGVDVDMNAISDTVMTLAVLALFADGYTRIRNVAHIRHKETDRLAAVATELRKLGATVNEYPDGLLIVPPDKITPATIATYDDHRMAMAFSLVGLKVPGVVIENPGCVAKTYPGYWQHLEQLGV